MTTGSSTPVEGGCMGTRVMTVRGPISSDELGVTLMHKHFCFGYPGWQADDSLAPYDRQAVEAECLRVLEGVKKAGIKTVVDATPLDVGGRDPILLKSLSEKSGINIIAVTGLYTECGGAPGYWKWQAEMGGRNIEEDLCELYTRELTVGIGTSGVRAGLLKVATSDPVITEYEKTAMRAAVRVSKELGVSITTHVEGPTVGPAQQDLFLEARRRPERDNDRPPEQFGRHGIPFVPGSEAGLLLRLRQDRFHSHGASGIGR